MHCGRQASTTRYTALEQFWIRPVHGGMTFSKRFKVHQIGQNLTNLESGSSGINQDTFDFLNGHLDFVFVVALHKQMQLRRIVWTRLFALFVKHALVRHRGAGLFGQGAHGLLVGHSPPCLLWEVVDVDNSMERRSLSASSLMLLPRRIIMQVVLCTLLLQRDIELLSHQLGTLVSTQRFSVDPSIQ